MSEFVGKKSHIQIIKSCAHGKQIFESGYVLNVFDIPLDLMVDENSHAEDTTIAHSACTVK